MWCINRTDGNCNVLCSENDACSYSTEINCPQNGECNINCLEAHACKETIINCAESMYLCFELRSNTKYSRTVCVL